MKILIAVPTFETVEAEVFKAIFDLDKGEHDVAFECFRGYDCARARNSIATYAVKNGYDHVLMIDSDTIVPGDALLNLLDPKEDIVLGCCPRKNTRERKSALCTWEDNPQGKGFHVSLSYDDLEGKDRIRLKGGGFACALVRTSVFERLQYPYFKYVVYKDGSALSEDFYFCKSANEQGITVWADPRVKCGHLARYYQYE